MNLKWIEIGASRWHFQIGSVYRVRREHSSVINFHIYLAENRERLKVCSVTTHMDELIFSVIDFRREKMKNECLS